MKTVVEYSRNDYEHFATLCRMLLRSPNAAIRSNVNAAILPLELVALHAYF